MSSAIISNYFVDEMSGILDEGKKITHDKLAGMVEVKLEDEKMWKKFKNLQDVSNSYTTDSSWGSCSRLNPAAGRHSTRRLVLHANHPIWRRIRFAHVCHFFEQAVRGCGRRRSGRCEHGYQIQELLLQYRQNVPHRPTSRE